MGGNGGGRERERSEIKGEWKERKKREKEVKQKSRGWNPDWVNQRPPASKNLFSISCIVIDFQMGPGLLETTFPRLHYSQCDEMRSKHLLRRKSLASISSSSLCPMGYLWVWFDSALTMQMRTQPLPGDSKATRR